jgi:hypothetical protein
MGALGVTGLDQMGRYKRGLWPLFGHSLSVPVAIPMMNPIVTDGHISDVPTQNLRIIQAIVVRKEIHIQGKKAIHIQ